MTSRVASFLQSFPGAFLLSLVLVLLAASPLLMGVEREAAWSMVPLTLSALLSFVVIPLFLIRTIFKMPFADFGWRLPEHPRRALLLTGAVLVGHLAIFLPLAWFDDFQSFYGLSGASPFLIFFFLVPISALYYLAEEFFFRGFLLNTLRIRYAGMAIALNALIFAFLHIGKPILELPLAIISSVVLCWLSLTTRSFLPAAIVHWALALLLNIAIYFVGDPSASAGFRF